MRASTTRKATSRRALRDACPDGIDVYFDNVGGDILDAALENMNDFGRLIECGMISRYNDAEPAPGPKHITNVVTRRLRMQGFIVIDYLARFAEAAIQLGDLGGRRQAEEPRARGRRIPVDADRDQHAVLR